MFFALVHYPALDAVSIKQLRKKYDPQVELIEPHITIVFPVPESIGEQHLIAHIQNVLLSWQPFTIRLKGLQSVLGQFQEGKSDLIRLEAEMYVGLLAKYHHEDASFVAHVTLGFSLDDRGQAASRGVGL